MMYLVKEKVYLLEGKKHNKGDSNREMRQGSKRWNDKNEKKKKKRIWDERNRREK